MKKKLVALAAAVATLALSAVMLAGCSGRGDAQSADSAATDGSFTLAVGFDQGYPPYGYVATTASSPASTWSLPKPCARRWAGS